MAFVFAAICKTRIYTTRSPKGVYAVPTVLCRLKTAGWRLRRIRANVRFIGSPSVVRYGLDEKPMDRTYRAVTTGLLTDSRQNDGKIAAPDRS